jgi:hypothetical protein
VRVGEKRQPGALLARDVRADPEIGHLLDPAPRGPETIARPLPPQRPWKRRLRHVDVYPSTRRRGHFQRAGTPGVTAGRWDRHLGQRTPRGAGTLELDHRASAGEVDGALAPLEQAQEGLEVLALGPDALVGGVEE